ncbi:hypothetical protein BESB_055960 [Besnoitia besnoiti]|uniref:Uncharacterized protein n=1 Tax=Besnoitia besnoiti TaxID=94643 RepID=A0A2A9MD81_BESBE|nr:hypothetical protein BESB_055960 [Besnoitia besnoiti]PFH35945.1 hypothetical protein BESB_055960 [Besnoitia besnoiti]
MRRVPVVSGEGEEVEEDSGSSQSVPVTFRTADRSDQHGREAGDSATTKQKEMTDELPTALPQMADGVPGLVSDVYASDEGHILESSEEPKSEEFSSKDELAGKQPPQEALEIRKPKEERGEGKREEQEREFCLRGRAQPEQAERLSGGSASGSAYAEPRQRSADSSSADIKQVVLEYEPVPDRQTQKSGYALVDSVNSFLDSWLVPEEGAKVVPPPAPIVAPVVVTKVDSAPQPHCRGEEAESVWSQLRSLQACTHIDLYETRPECPKCHQPLPGDKRPQPQTWTRWIFKQCEEPVDLQAEFLVYPNPLVYIGRPRPDIDQPWFGTTSYVPA